MEVICTFSNMSAGVLNCWIAVDIWQQSEAEAVFIVRRVSETIHKNTSWRGVVGFSYPIVQFIVDNGAPMAWLLILHWLHIWKQNTQYMEPYIWVILVLQKSFEIKYSYASLAFHLKPFEREGYVTNRNELDLFVIKRFFFRRNFLDSIHTARGTVFALELFEDYKNPFWFWLHFEQTISTSVLSVLKIISPKWDCSKHHLRQIIIIQITTLKREDNLFT